jgi:hypothetical protein
VELDDARVAIPRAILETIQNQQKTLTEWA